MTKAAPRCLYGSVIDKIGCTHIVMVLCRVRVRVKTGQNMLLMYAKRWKPSVYQGAQGIISPLLRLNRGGGGREGLFFVSKNRFR